MRRLAVIFSIVSAATVVISLVAMTTDPDPFSASSIALIAFGLMACTLVAMTGFLLVRAPWGRWSLVAVTTVSMLLSTSDDTLAVAAVLALGAIAIVGLAGPWLRFWVRQQPVPDALNWVVVTLMAVAPVAPLVIGFGAYDSASVWSWIAALAAVSASFMYGRGLPGSLWLLRFAVPITAAPAVIASPLPYTAAVALGALAVAVFAWLPQARHAVTAPPPVLPAPQRRRSTNDASE